MITAPLGQRELLDLPPAFDLETAGRAWGFGRTKSYELARRDQFPCPVLRLGHAYRVTRADLLRSLGLDPDMPAAGASEAPAAIHIAASAPLPDEDRAHHEHNPGHPR